MIVYSLYLYVHFNSVHVHYCYILYCLVPSASPTDLRVVERKLTSITVKWQPIPENLTNGNLTGYKIRYRKYLGGDFAYLTKNWTSKSLPQAKITDLEKSTAYDISIAGYTDAGTGPFSQAISVKTKQSKKMKPHIYLH